MSRSKKPAGASRPPGESDNRNRLGQIASQLRKWGEDLRIVWRQLPALPDPETDPDTYQRLAIDRERILSQIRSNANRLLGEARKLGAFSEGNQEFAEGDFTTLVYHWLPSVGVELSPHAFGRAALGLGLAYADYLETLANQIRPQRTSDKSPDRFPGKDLPSEPTESVVSDTADNAASMRAIAALAGSETLQLQSIAQDQNLTTEDKLRRMAEIDRRIYGMNGGQLADVCGVSAPMIRKTAWWRVDRKTFLNKGRDEDDSGEL